MKKLVPLMLVLVLLLSVSLPVFAAQSVGTATGLPEIRITLSDGLTLSEVNAGSKDTKYPDNTVTLVNPDGSESTYEGVELKGRGNFTWNQPQMLKKPYQLKFDKKTDVFGMGKAKKWVLLANYSDGTLMRNRLAFDLAAKIGMPYTPESVWVELYVNGEYIGNYLLCEKNEAGSTRVDIKDKYGVLCEIDGNYGTSEDVYYITKTEKTVVVLSDSVADDVGAKNSVSEAAFAAFCEKLDRLEALLYDDDAAWDEIAELIDVESFIRYYFIQELVEDSDGCRSSFFLWSDGKDDVIHLGPVWDFDIAMGAFTPQYLGGNPAVDYSVNIEDFMGSSSVGWFKQLFGFYAFDRLAVEQYNSEIKPVYDSIPLIIDGYLTEELVSSAERNFEKWDKILGHSSVFGSTGRKYASTYEDEVEFLGTWLQRRVGYLNARYASAPALNQHSHTDADGDGVCDICGEKLELSDMLTGILNALNPIRWIMLLITGIRDLLARLFLR